MSILAFYFSLTGASTSLEPRAKLSIQVTSSPAELAKPRRPDIAVSYASGKYNNMLIDGCWVSAFSASGGSQPEVKKDECALVNNREAKKASLYQKPSRLPRGGASFHGVAFETFGIIGPACSNLLEILKESISHYKSCLLELIRLIPRYLYLAIPWGSYYILLLLILFSILFSIFFSSLYLLFFFFTFPALNPYLFST